MPRTLADNVLSVEARITSACIRSGRARHEVILVAVTKTVPAEVATLLPSLGVPHLAENRPQELWKKAAAIPEARWHMIGHLQRNKIDKTAPMVELIHSVDSVRLLDSLSAFGAKLAKARPILLEVNCSQEPNKGGFAPEELPGIADKLMSLPGVQVQGLMTMAAYSDNPEVSRAAFAKLRQLRDQLRTLTGLALPHLSMGMSNDFEIAIEEGATFVRIGSLLFEGLTR